MRKFLYLVLLSTLWTSGAVNAEDKRPPSLDDYLNLSVIGNAEISPDGRHIAYSVFRNDFDNDKDMNQLWVVPVAGGAAVQLTQGEDPVGEFEWSADGDWLAFMRDNQLNFIRIAGGEPITPDIDVEGISNLTFAPDNSALYFIAGAQDRPWIEAREERFGKYTVYREDGNYRLLWRINLTSEGGLGIAGEPVQLTTGRDSSVTGFALSPDGEAIAFTSWPSPHLVDLMKSKVHMIDAGGGAAAVIDDTRGYKSTPVWHDNGSRLAFTNNTAFPEYSDIVLIDPDGENRMTIDMPDHDASIIHFGGAGILFNASVRTTIGLFRLDPDTAAIERLTPPDGMDWNYTASRNGSTLAWLHADSDGLGELMAGTAESGVQRSTMSDQLADFLLPSKELMTWESDNGLEIEAVLTLPPDYEPGRPYPLYVRTHGGPTSTDRPLMAGVARSTFAPEVLAVEGGGAIVLQTNYRGSSGYGEAFQKSNLNNLGIGPARDIIAGVERLIEAGRIDPDRIACLGWSQGGHISAMLATYSDICTAAIMGAGISDWRTYYYNTDITLFTTEYFNATPLANDAVYAKTSPVTYIDRASTPVLIQHGENDQRVPIANGFQLRQLLLDKGVEARMIVYSGMGHGPSSPKTRRAITTHALDWFRHHLHGAPSPDFVHPVEPETDDDEAEDEIY